ncbi:uncharacterized protein LOC133292288 [Gastrolobium bilobum]|uniref:uncharacterized protein LOC133292288 n=1 Tax=Gastrolobium bilobum TaxID=150636 RepID=UPI002AB221C4|nr:uncharacterized protein LOC133292288 [Gastrolobium bilobum]
MVDNDDYVLPNRNSNDCSMVVIHDKKDYSIFPPINHENLQILSNQFVPQSPPSSSSSSSSSSSECSCSTFDSDLRGLSSSSSPFDSRVRKGRDFIGLMSVSLEILGSKLFAMVSSFRNRACADRGAFWSIGVPAAAIVMSCWIIMLTRKKRRNETRLINIIKEKDGRIAQLLHQIAQMNEILIAHHKSVAAKVVE